MRLRTIQANGIVFTALLGAFGLTACVQMERQTTVFPASPSAYGLFYMDEGRSAKLAYGAPNSDDVSLMMECVKGSRTVDVSDVARDGAPAAITLVSGGKSARLKTLSSNGDGSDTLLARATTDAPPLLAFRRSGRLVVSLPGAKYVIAASAAEQTGVERFFGDCDRQTATVAAIQPR